jgi:hypothetical protein
LGTLSPFALGERRASITAQGSFSGQASTGARPVVKEIADQLVFIVAAGRLPVSVATDSILICAFPAAAFGHGIGLTANEAVLRILVLLDGMPSLAKMVIRVLNQAKDTGMHIVQDAVAVLALTGIPVHALSNVARPACVG